MKKLLSIVLLFLFLISLCACNKECPHDWILDINQDATCVSDGYQEFHCSICGETFRLDTDKATGHTPKYASPKTVKSATCTDYGEGKQTCSVCGEEYTVPIPKKDHNYKNHICTMCGAADRPIFFTDLKCEKKSGGVIVFSANIHNYTGKKLEFVEVTLELMDSKGNVIDTDWTYAVGSEGIKNKSKAFFDLWYSGVSYGEISSWSLSVKDYSYAK